MTHASPLAGTLGRVPCHPGPRARAWHPNMLHPPQQPSNWCPLKACSSCFEHNGKCGVSTRYERQAACVLTATWPAQPRGKPLSRPPTLPTHQQELASQPLTHLLAHCLEGVQVVDCGCCGACCGHPPPPPPRRRCRWPSRGLCRALASVYAGQG